jgi:hypothetical protein
MLVLVPAMWARPVAAQSINQREASATAKIAESRGLYDGSFTGTGIASICGEIPKEASITGEAVFVVEYPSDDPGASPIQSIAFGSNQLVGGDTVATIFRLNVHVRKPDGAKPNGYVLNTDGRNAKNTGTATLTKTEGALTLRVIGSNDMGEKIELVLSCKVTASL